ncbi:MAG: hypothetical protein AABY32_04410 [Nanoarchaeota archaeon]
MYRNRPKEYIKEESVEVTTDYINHKNPTISFEKVDQPSCCPNNREISLVSRILLFQSTYHYEKYNKILNFVTFPQIEQRDGQLDIKIEEPYRVVDEDQSVNQILKKLNFL